MTATRYFVLGRVPGTAHNRYAVLAGDGRTVTGVLISRPDGVEVPWPANVRWRIEPFVGGKIASARFNNVSPRPRSGPIADADEKRRRGYARSQFGRLAA